MQTPWWQTFFSGLVMEAWIGNPYYAALTPGDVDFLLKTLAPAPGARILDVPCGDGRIALPLAAIGFHVTGVDIAGPNIEAANRTAKEHSATATFEQREMRDLPWNAEFDHAYCFGNSF